MAATEFLQAADEARRLLRGFKALETVAAALDMAGLAEQAKGEAEAALVALKPQIDAAKAELGHALTDVALAKSKAAELVDAAHERAAAITAAALEKANESNAAAEAKLADAATRCESMLAAAASSVAESAAERNALVLEIDTLQGKLDKLKAQASKLLG